MNFFINRKIRKLIFKISSFRFEKKNYYEYLRNFQTKINILK